MTDKRTFELRDQYPDPGTDPVARLRHVLDVEAEMPDDQFVHIATSGIHPARTGLTFGDLRKLLALTEFMPRTTEELKVIINALVTEEDTYGDFDGPSAVRARFEAELERRKSGES